MCEKEVAKDNNKIKGISKRKLYLNLLNENIQQQQQRPFNGL